MQTKRDDFTFSEDDFSIKLTAAHCRAARGWLGWTQAELSRQSGVGLSTIKDYEKGNRRTHKGVQILLQSTFAKAGVWCSEEGIWDERLVDLTGSDPDDASIR
jgi:transcriptional regulator with XRE-family HTH domain